MRNVITLLCAASILLTLSACSTIGSPLSIGGSDHKRGYTDSQQSSGLRLIQNLQAQYKANTHSIEWRYGSHQQLPNQAQRDELAKYNFAKGSRVSINIGPTLAASNVKSLLLVHQRASQLANLFTDHALSITTRYVPTLPTNAIQIDWVGENDA